MTPLKIVYFKGFPIVREAPPRETLCSVVCATARVRALRTLCAVWRGCGVAQCDAGESECPALGSRLCRVLS